MKTTLRKYSNDSDNEKIRQFLYRLFLLNNRHEYNWPVYRWDYWYWHVNKNIFQFDLNAAIFMWENPYGELVALLHPDNKGEVFMQVAPDYHSGEMEIEMMAVAEMQFSVLQPNGEQQLTIFAGDNDLLRQDLLLRRGYSRDTWPEYQRRRDMSEPVPEVLTPLGFTLRPMGDQNDDPARSWLSWKAFHPDEPDSAYKGWEWYLNVEKAPLYRRDLDLVAQAPNGDLAAFATVWWDSKTQTAAFEPVGTHPTYRRLGLARALMAEGIRRAKALGATLMTVGSYSESAGALYASLGFREYDLSVPWVKNWR